jgi:hypothetical protein
MMLVEWPDHQNPKAETLATAVQLQAGKQVRALSA